MVSVPFGSWKDLLQPVTGAKVVASPDNLGVTTLLEEQLRGTDGDWKAIRFLFFFFKVSSVPIQIELAAL